MSPGGPFLAKRYVLRRLSAASIAVVALISAGVVAIDSPSYAASSFDPLAAVNRTGTLSAAQAQSPIAVSAEVSADSMGMNQPGTVDIQPITSAPLIQRNGAKVATLPNYGFVVGRSTDGLPAGFAVMADRSAPSVFGFRLTSSSAGPLSLSLGPTGAVVVTDKAGKFVNLVQAPWAVDANGNSIPTSYSVRGDELLQSVNLSDVSAFPVVADPKIACDGVFCTAEYNRAETKTIVDQAGDWTIIISVGCTLIAGAAGGAACAISGSLAHSVAVTARSHHHCLGFRWFPYYPSPAFPVEYSGGNCR